MNKLEYIPGDIVKIEYGKATGKIGFVTITFLRRKGCYSLVVFIGKGFQGSSKDDWIVLCKRWKPWCHNLFCYLYLHKENKNLMVGSHFTMTEDKKKSTRLATNEERLMLFEEMFKYGIAFDKHVHHLVGKLVGV